jgi:hypothetical protein
MPAIARVSLFQRQQDWHLWPTRSTERLLEGGAERSRPKGEKGGGEVERA